MHFLFAKRTRVFLIIWLGQFLSIIGSGMTSFVLGIWVFQRHSSTTQFSTVVLAAAAGDPYGSFRRRASTSGTSAAR
jgi:hypothetical protein